MFFIYSKFKGSHWQNYSPDKRLKILQALENKMAKKCHREAVPVVVNPDPNYQSLGSFEVRNNTKHILINEDLIYKHELRFHALETIIHEGRHAYQYLIVKKDKVSPLNFQAKQWKKNWQGYFSSSENNTIYTMQALEQDAQKFTIKMLKKLAYKYENEKAFQATLKANIARLQDGELNARKEYGIFYKQKINKAIEHKNKYIKK